jgi:L,D-transpeptidase ErfK/SrfK
MKQQLSFAFAVALASLAWMDEAPARGFALPSGNDAVVGQVEQASARYEDTLLDMARAGNIGYQEIRLANFGVDPWVPGAGTPVRIPNQYILPQGPREGITVNVPEMRIYYYRRGDGSVQTYPISIGRQDWATPKGGTRIIAKKLNPSWTPPPAIRAEHAEDGDILPAVVPPGPDNPLGLYALALGIHGYLLHGTDKPLGIGMRVTHGCMRMYPEDIENIFNQVSVGTPVQITNQPHKVGWLNGDLYIEVHPHLLEDHRTFGDRFNSVADLIVKSAQGRSAEIDWNVVRTAVSAFDGVPVKIGRVAAGAAAPAPGI